MPKIIELTVEIEVQKVSCPGVWLCQDGRVSLTVFALGTSYQTCMLPPVFPLLFNDVFYFKRRFEETCAVNNICCLLKDETIYCELVQWIDNCGPGFDVLAQYLGNLSDVLFPPNMCSNEGVDLLMRRSSDFPGILAPKIEIATKVRIDEIWNSKASPYMNSIQVKTCHCSVRPDSDGRQRQVCHSPQYHRNKCTKKSPKGYRSRSRSGSRSCGSLKRSDQDLKKGACCCASGKNSQVYLPAPHSRACSPARSRLRQYNVYNVETPDVDAQWRDVIAAPRSHDANDLNRDLIPEKDRGAKLVDNPINQCQKAMSKMILESRHIAQAEKQGKQCNRVKKSNQRFKVSPCVCEICKKYHELFHTSS